MSEKIIDDGGPAFPVPVSSGYGPGFFSVNLRGAHEFISIEGGLTLRDYFAGQALISILRYNEQTSIESDCQLSYDIADKMIEARKKATT
jgi:hypothetical protein